MNIFDGFTLDELIDYLGMPTKKRRDRYHWQCPGCQDKKQDNLVFTPSKGIVKTWCCEYSRELCGELLKIRHAKNREFYKPAYVAQREEKIPTEPQKPVVTEDKHLENKEYFEECRDELLNNPSWLSYLEKQRGITKDTAYLGIGMDKQKKCWVLPVYDIIRGNQWIIGFEYRGLYFNNKTIWKATGTYSCISPVNTKTEQTEIMIVLEGLWDALCFYQHLLERGQAHFYHIFSPSNGVASVLNCLKSFDFTPYKQVVLYLDSDEKGKKAMEEAKNHFHYIKTIVMDCGCKDFNEHYLKCIKQKQGQIQT